MNAVRWRPAALPALALAGACLAGPARAQFYFAGPEQYGQAPISLIAAGPPVDLLQTASNPGGFIVAGTFNVPIAAAPASGLLARWSVVRELALNVNLSFQTLTLLVGFAAPPPGTFNTSFGSVDTYVYEPAGNTIVPGSFFSIPLTLTAGSATWATAAVSPSFNLVTGQQRYYVRQDFYLFGDYVSGPGGTWVVDVPITTTMTPVPEPAAWQMLPVGAAGLTGAVWWRRRRPAAAGA